MSGTWITSNPKILQACGEIEDSAQYNLDAILSALAIQKQGEDNVLSGEKPVIASEPAESNDQLTMENGDPASGEGIHSGRNRIDLYNMMISKRSKMEGRERKMDAVVGNKAGGYFLPKRGVRKESIASLVERHTKLLSAGSGVRVSSNAGVFMTPR